MSIRDCSDDAEVKVLIKNAAGEVVEFVTLTGTGDGTGVLNLAAGHTVAVQDIDSPGNGDDAKIEYDVN